MLNAYLWKSLQLESVRIKRTNWNVLLSWILNVSKRSNINVSSMIQLKLGSCVWWHDFLLRTMFNNFQFVNSFQFPYIACFFFISSATCCLWRLSVEFLSFYFQPKKETYFNCSILDWHFIMFQFKIHCHRS